MCIQYLKIKNVSCLWSAGNPSAINLIQIGFFLESNKRPTLASQI